MLNKKMMLVISIAVLIGSTAFGQNKYVGADKCKMCHNSPAKGEQYNKWAASTHSKAMASLSSPAALEYAKKNGIADPAKDAKCTKCHSTYASVDASLIATLTEADGVSCESCHGPGSAYKAMAIMKDQAQAKANGMIVPDEATCKKCHTPEGNPFYKEFNYAASLAKITHPNPAKAK